MSSVDNRVVNLEFNNKGFEQGVAQTLRSIENLKKVLISKIRLDQYKTWKNRLRILIPRI